MNRTLVFLLVLLAVGGAAALAFLALDGDGATPRAPGASPRAGTAAPGASGDDDPAAPAHRRRRREAPPGVAADTVAVAGVVSDPDGAPIEGARVTCHLVPAGEPDDETRMMRSMLGDLLTDEELAIARKEFGRPGGPFAGAMRPPRARVSAAARPAAGTAGVRAEVKVAVGEPAADDEDAQAAAQRFGVDIGRRVMSDAGGMSRLMRSIQVLTAGFEDDALLPVADETLTDAKGTFRFEALPAGARVELRVTAERRQRAKRRAQVGDLRVAIALGAASVLTGEVRSEGRPLAGAQVRLRTQTLTTGANGRFVYAQARPPREPVLVSARGHAPAGAHAKVPDTGDPELLVIELFPAGSVRGRITARDGAPLPGAQVTILREGMSVFLSMIPGSQLTPTDPSAVTGEDGTYLLEGLPSGKVKLRASRAGHLGATAGPFNVLPNETLDGVDFALAKESSLSGRVTGPDGAPIADATVGVSVPTEGAFMKMAAQGMGGIWATARTDADGRYRVGGVGEGQHDVYAESEGHLKQKAQTTLPAESGATLDFTLPLGHEIAGVVLAPDGTQVAGARVRVTGPSELGGNPWTGAVATPVGKAVGGTDGRFVVKGLPDGPYGVTASAKGFLDADVTGVQPGETSLSLQLGAAATIRGRVVAAADGKPVAGATVAHAAPGGGGGNAMGRAPRGGGGSVAADADGRFEITGLKGGTFVLSARGAGYAESAATKVPAATGAVVEGIELALPPGSSVSGRVVRKGDGTPVEGAVVYVSFDKSPMAGMDFGALLGTDPVAPPDSSSAKTTADGAFLLEGLSPGKVVVEVRARDFAPLSAAGTEAPSAGVVCEISAGGAVEGIVYSKAGVPLEGATIMLQRGMGAGFGGVASTDRAGRFRIERLAPASYQAILLDPESPMGLGGMKGATVRDGETTRLEFNQKAGGRVVSGDVVRDGKAFADAGVVLFGGTSGMQTASADAAGRFTFEGVEAGSYTVTVQTQMMGGGNASAKVTVTADADPAPVHLELSGLKIEGSVNDAETGKGVPQAQVVLHARGAAAGGSIQELMARQRGQTFTAADGRFRLESVPEGAFDLRVVAGDYAESVVENVTPGATDVRVVLSKGIELAVTVTGPDDRPVANAMVVPLDASGKEGIAFDMSQSKQTGTDGVARMRLAPGRWLLRVRAASYPEASVTVDAGQGAASVRIEEGGAIEVLAKKVAGGPAAGAKVTLLDAQGAVISGSMSMGNLFGAGDTTDASGRAIRDGLRVGRVTVIVKSASGAETRSQAIVSPGDVTKVDVTLSD